MEKKTLWQRSEDYAKKVSGEIIEQIKKGTAPWQQPPSRNRQETRPSSGLDCRRCERKQTPQNRVKLMRGRSWQKTVEDASLLCKQVFYISKAQGEPRV